MGRLRRPASPFWSRLRPIELSLSCLDIPPMRATQSALTVFAVLWVRKQPGKRWQEHGRTEPVRHGTAPQFGRSFFLDFLDHNDNLRNEDYDCTLRVELYQWAGSNADNLDKQKFCGHVETTLRELYRTPIKRWTSPLRLPPSRVISQGSIQVHICDAPAAAELQPYVELQLRASNLDDGGGGRRGAATAQYFITVHRYTSGGRFELVHRTELARRVGTGPDAVARAVRFSGACVPRRIRWTAWPR
jgi:hypothetical protein